MSVDPIEVGWEFRKLLGELYDLHGRGGLDLREQYRRDIVCTPYGGLYERTAGWVACVNGSPPRGTLLIPGEQDGRQPVFWTQWEARLVRRPRHLRVIAAFRVTFLQDAALLNDARPFVLTGATADERPGR